MQSARPTSPLSSKLSAYTPLAGKTVTKMAAPAAQAPENAVTAKVSSSKSITKIKSKSRIILASITGLGALGTAIGIYIKGVPKLGFLKRKPLPVKTVTVYVQEPNSSSGFWEYLFGCASGSALGYFAHQAGEKARLNEQHTLGRLQGERASSNEINDLRVELEYLRSGNRTSPGVPASISQAQQRGLIANGRNSALEELQTWATPNQTINHSTLLYCARG